MICKNCGVELEEDMAVCPLCGQPAGSDLGSESSQDLALNGPRPPFVSPRMSRPQKKVTWQVISIILLSGSAASFIVDFFINHQITWSEYTVAIGLTIFSYVSLFAFWEQQPIFEIIAGFVVSSFFLLLLDALTNGISWSIWLAIPLLFAANLIVILLMAIIRSSRYKGINLIAYGFCGAALLSVFVEAALSFFETRQIRLRWSIIVTACLIPVIVVLYFLHYRFKKGRDLKKTFHM